MELPFFDLCGAFGTTKSQQAVTEQVFLNTCASLSGTADGGQRWHGKGFKADERGLRITKCDLEEAMDEVSSGVMSWDPDRYQLVKTLQEAGRNHGRVDMMQRREGRGGVVAVKRMPNKWVRTGPKEFKSHYPTTTEQPWCDLGFVRQLNSLKFPFACDLLGVFRDSQHTYVVTSLATEGDLFSWCFRGPKPGRDREAYVLPIVTQIFSALKWLHELGIAHRDISLENILLTEAGSDKLRVKIIDFGMGTVATTCRGEARGKPSYQAPEMHLETEYDTMLADVFATGVVVFSLMAQNYPWKSTKQNGCPFFDYASAFGFRKFLETQKMLDIFTPACIELMEGLLQTQPQKRIGLGESYLARERAGRSRRSVWELKWLQFTSSPTTPPRADRCGSASKREACLWWPKNLCA